MARTKAVLGDGARLSDFLCASLFARMVPPEVVHAVLDKHGRNTQRVRSFAAVAGAYYCMALSLYPEAACEEVFAAVSQGLAWAAGAAQPAVVGKSSISALRSRIGSQSLRDLVQRCCIPLANAEEHPQGFYAALRLVAIDGSCFELPDEADNAAMFGYPGSRTSLAGHAGYPQARCVVLVECATHAILGANLGPCATGERELTTPLLARLKPGMLCLAGQMVAAPRCHAPPNTSSRVVFQGTCRTPAPHTAPIRGLSPQSGPDVGHGGSLTCCRPAPVFVQREPSTDVRLALSSDEIRNMPSMTTLPPHALRWIAHPSRWPSRRVRPCRAPFKGASQYNTGHRPTFRVALSSKRTVLG